MENCVRNLINPSVGSDDKYLVLIRIFDTIDCQGTFFIGCGCRLPNSASQRARFVLAPPVSGLFIECLGLQVPSECPSIIGDLQDIFL